MAACANSGQATKLTAGGAGDKNPDIRAAALAALAAAEPPTTASAPAPDSSSDETHYESADRPTAQTSPRDSPHTPAPLPASGDGPEVAMQHNSGDAQHHSDIQALQQASKPLDLPAAAAMTGEAAPASPAGPAVVSAVPATPPQLPARPALQGVGTSDDGGLCGNNSDAGSAAASAVAAGAAVPAEPTEQAEAADLPGAAAACIAKPHPPPDVASPFDRALAAHLAKQSQPGGHSASSDSRCLQTPHTAAGSLQSSSSCVTAVLPREPVVRSFGQAATPAAEARVSPPQQAQHHQQQPTQHHIIVSAAVPAGAAGAELAHERPLDAAPGSAVMGGRLPAERLRGLAAQQLSPPPWAQPTMLTPTGHTAQVCTDVSIRALGEQCLCSS